VARAALAGPSRRGQEIKHFTILFARKTTKMMIEICEIEIYLGDWKAFVEDNDLYCNPGNSE
jgi:hypothetical protein